jgi:hypothetical protein
MIKKYSTTLESQMQSYYAQLSEKEKRRYAALEAQKFDYGGKVYIMKLFDIHHMTLNKGIEELNNPDLCLSIPAEKQRKSGGGRKKKQSTTLIV